MLSLPVLFVSSLLCGNPAPDLDNAVLDFTAKWCGPCQQMSPLVSKLERDGLPIHKIDVDQNQKLAKKYGITSIPAFVLVVNGKVVKQLTGGQSEETLRQLCRQVTAADPPATASPGGSVKTVDVRPIADATPGAPPDGRFEPRGEGRRPGDRAQPDQKPGPGRGQSPEKPKNIGPAITNQPFPATVRIRVKDASGDDVGTGTIILNSDDQALILTCGHLFKHWDDKTSRLMVEVFERGTGRVVPARKIAVDADADVALISISTDTPLPSCPLAPRGTIPAKNTALVSVGCNGGQPPTIEQHKVVAQNRYKGPDNLECTGIPVRGRSGGGLFNQSGQVVGVCMAEDPNYKDGMYAGLEPVYRLLARNRLGHLFDASDSAGAPPDDRDLPDEVEELDELPGDLPDEAEGPSIAGEPEEAEASPEDPSGDAATQRLLRKALAQARKGDIVCLIPDIDGDSTLGNVLVIHDPDDELRRTLAGGPEAGPARSASFRGLPPADVRVPRKSPPSPPRRNPEEEMQAPPEEWGDDQPETTATPRSRGRSSNTSRNDSPLPERTAGGFRRGRPMSLRGRAD